MIWRRIRNLWALSNFKITEFDNKLVITKKDDKLIVELPEVPPKMAQIIRKRDPIKEVLQEEN